MELSFPRERTKQLEREDRELRRANEIVKLTPARPESLS